MAVLVALLLMDDVKDDKPDVNGSAVWAARTRRNGSTRPRTCCQRATIIGLYIKAGAGNYIDVINSRLLQLIAQLHFSLDPGLSIS